MSLRERLFEDSPFGGLSNGSRDVLSLPTAGGQGSGDNGGGDNGGGYAGGGLGAGVVTCTARTETGAEF